MKIEKGVPLPEKRVGGSGGQCKYPFKSLEIGDSFFVAPTSELAEPMRSLKSLVSVYNKKLAPKKFAIRREGLGARVFRVG